MIRYCCFSCIVCCVPYNYGILCLLSGGGGGARSFFGSTMVLGGRGGGSVARDTYHIVYNEAPGMG